MPPKFTPISSLTSQNIPIPHFHLHNVCQNNTQNLSRIYVYLSHKNINTFRHEIEIKIFTSKENLIFYIERFTGSSSSFVTQLQHFKCFLRKTMLQKLLPNELSGYFKRKYLIFQFHSITFFVTLSFRTPTNRRAPRKGYSWTNVMDSFYFKGYVFAKGFV